MESAQNTSASVEDEVNQQTAKLLTAERWIGPIGSTAAPVTFFFVLQGLVDQTRLEIWLIVSLIVSLSHATVVIIPPLWAWRSKSGVPLLSRIGHALVGMAAGGLALVDTTALGNDRAVQMALTSYVFAMTLGITLGLPALGPLTPLTSIPMWFGMITGLFIAGLPWLATAILLCGLLLTHGVRQERLLWSELIELRLSAKAEAKRRRFEAQVDSLTGLYNRAGTDAKIATLIGESAPTASFAVFYIDLDRFKPINDTHGHASGDEVLVEVGRRLRSVCRKSDVVARIGGDEFMIIVPPELDQVRSPHDLAKRVIAIVDQPINLSNGSEVSVSASVGLAEGPVNDGNLDSVISRADRAMYEAKRPPNAPDRRRPPTDDQGQTDSISVNTEP